MNTNNFSTCQNCGMTFESNKGLMNHKQKFCVDSKYGNLEELQKEFKSASKGRDISLYGRMSLVRDQKLPERNIDLEYATLLQQIHKNEQLKVRLAREKEEAFKELQKLDKMESQIIVEKKRSDLQKVMKQKQQLRIEEQELQREINNFQQKKKQYSKDIEKQQTKDLDFQEGKKVGKTQLQRKMLQEQLVDIEHKLSDKKRKYDRIFNELNASKISQIPQIQSKLQPHKQSSVQVPKQDTKFSIVKPLYQQSQQQSKYPKASSHKSQFQASKDNEIQHSKTASNASSFLRPQMLNFKQKTLTQLVNHHGKSQQDILIQTLIAQQYDDLNILSKLPKNSELYEIKMKQFVEMSKLRTDLKEKAQNKRIQKMKRQFDYELRMQDKQLQNALFVDQNRKIMIAKQTQLLQNPDFSKKTYNPKINQFQQSNKRIQNIFEQTHQNPNLRPDSNNLRKIKKNQQQIRYQPSSIKNTEQKEEKQQRRKISNKNNAEQNLWGYRISVLNLRNYTRSKTIKVKVSIYEDGQSQNTFQQQFSTGYHDPISNQRINPRNPNRNDKLSTDGSINFNESFIVKKNLQQLHNRNQQQIFLIIEVQEKNEVKLTTTEPPTYCWYSYKITHFGRIRQGRFSFNLYADEVVYNFDMNKMKKKLQQEIQIELEQVILANLPIEEKLPQISTQIKKSIPQKQQQQGQRQIQSPSSEISKHSAIVSKQSLKSVKSNRVIQQKKPKRNHIFNQNKKPFNFLPLELKKSHNFDFAIGQVRTLPSYIGPIKLQINFIDQNSNAILQKEQILSELGTDFYNPYINYLCQCRNSKVLPPTTRIFIRILAISTLNYEVYMLGFSIFFLYYDSQGMPIQTNKAKQIFTCEGLFQIPIYWANVQPKYFQIKYLFNQYKRIPGVSMLIRLSQNQSQISNQMQEYINGDYNTSLFQLQENELSLIQSQYKREIPDSNKHIKGFLQYKGINKNYTGEQASKYIFKTLAFDSGLQIYNVNAMAEYNSKFGIYFFIDQLMIPEGFGGYYYFLTICLSPPANYYKETFNDLKYVYKIDIKSSSSKYNYFHDNQLHFQLNYDQKAYLIIEINRIKIICEEPTEDMEGYGHLVIPLFDYNAQAISVNVGKFTQKIFQGDFDTNKMNLAGNQWSKYHQKNTDQIMQAQLSFRLANGYFPNQHKPNPVVQAKKRLQKFVPQGIPFEQISQRARVLINLTYKTTIT